MRADDGVVHEMLETGIRIGAGVQENEIPVGAGHDGRQGGAVEAFKGAEFENRCRHQAAGIAATDRRDRFAVLHQLDGAHHRRIFFAADGKQRLVIHGNHFRGVTHGHRRMTGEPCLGQQGFQNRGVAHQNERTEPGVFGQGQAGRLDDFGWSEIAAHGVNGDTAGGGHVCHRLGAGGAESPAQSPPGFRLLP